MQPWVQDRIFGSAPGRGPVDVPFLNLFFICALTTKSPLLNGPEVRAVRGQFGLPWENLPQKNRRLRRAGLPHGAQVSGQKKLLPPRKKRKNP